MVDGNGFLSDPGYMTATPSVPATGVYQQKTNLYPIRV